MTALSRLLTLTETGGRTCATTAVVAPSAEVI